MVLGLTWFLCIVLSVFNAGIRMMVWHVFDSRTLVSHYANFGRRSSMIQSHSRCRIIAATIISSSERPKYLLCIILINSFAWTGVGCMHYVANFCHRKLFYLKAYAKGWCIAVAVLTVVQNIWKSRSARCGGDVGLESKDLLLCILNDSYIAIMDYCVKKGFIQSHCLFL